MEIILYVEYVMNSTKSMMIWFKLMVEYYKSMMIWKKYA